MRDIAIGRKTPTWAALLHILSLSVLWASPAGADTSTRIASESSRVPMAGSREPEDSPEPGNAADAELPGNAGPLAIAASVLPGVLVHGSGHWVAGRRDTARSIAYTELGALGLMLSSGTYMTLSGGSRHGNEVMVPLLLSGTGLFVGSWLADIDGVISGGNRNRQASIAPLRASLGYAYIDEPVFSYRHLSTLELAVSLDAWQLEPSLWISTTSDNFRASLPLRYRAWQSEEGDSLSVGTALRHHRYGDEGFSTQVAEVEVSGRIQLQRLGAGLSGSFLTLSVGWGLERIDYNLPGVGADYSGLSIGGFGYGICLPKQGEMVLYYNHRRDDWAAGSSERSLNLSGILGHAGIRIRQPISWIWNDSDVGGWSDGWSIGGRSEIGSAWVSQIFLEKRIGQ